MNRAILFRDTAAELNRQDKVGFFPTWLRSAESRLDNLLRLPEMVKRAILPVGGKIFPRPNDFLKMESITVQQGVSEVTAGTDIVPRDTVGQLFYCPPAEMDQNPSGFRTRVPYWYTMRGPFFELSNFEAADPFQVQMFYYARLSPLGSDTDTTWLLERMPHVYKNAMLHFAYMHLEEYDTARTFQEIVAAECTALNDRAEENRYGSGPLIKQPVRRFGGRFS